MTRHKKTIGIMGGMGPGATVHLFSLITGYTRAQTDQEHIHILVDNRPAIPDRSAFILGKGTDPVPEMRRSARLLEKMGADFILIPCNTAHYFLDEIRKELGIPIVNMIETVACCVMEHHGKNCKPGLLATLGTYRTGLYQKYFSEKGMDIIVPEPEDQVAIMEAIYGKQGIKAGLGDRPAEILFSEALKLTDRGAELIISGCTEISAVLGSLNPGFVFVCPMQVLARHAVELAGYPLR